MGAILALAEWGFNAGEVKAAHGAALRVVGQLRGICPIIRSARSNRRRQIARARPRPSGRPSASQIACARSLTVCSSAARACALTFSLR
jgi:hypothetical protein